MTTQEYTNIKGFLETPRKIVITTHRSPDGDAMGSSLGLYHYLNGLGHRVQVITPDDYPAFLQWLPGNEHVLQFHAHRKEASEITAEADAIFCLDFNQLGRIEAFGEEVEKSKALKVLIDHHQQPADFADYMLSDTTASSTAQLVYDFIVGLGDKKAITKDIGSCLYTGIVTDTGSFRFSSTSPHTHRIAADLIEVGVRPDLIHHLVYDTNSPNRLRLLGYSISEKLEVMEELGAGLIYLSSEELKRFRFKKGDTEGVVNYALSVEGIVLAILITEQDNMVKLSFRSKGSFDVNRFAREHFEGGGHKNAAGGRSRVSFDETLEKLRSTLPEYKDALNQARADV